MFYVGECLNTGDVGGGNSQESYWRKVGKIWKESTAELGARMTKADVCRKPCGGEDNTRKGGEGEEESKEGF